MTDEKKKLVMLIALIVVACAVLGYTLTKGGGIEPKGEAAGSLEGNVNTKTGLPLNPPSSDADPSLGK